MDTNVARHYVIILILIFKKFKNKKKNKFGIKFSKKNLNFPKFFNKFVSRFLKIKIFSRFFFC